MNLQPTCPRLDPVAVARLQELDPDGHHGVVRRVLEAFESSLTRMRGQLDGLLQHGDRRGVSMLAHTLKSSAASVGALALSQVCAETERRLREGGGEDLPYLVEALTAEADTALVAVRAMLQST